MNTRNQHLTGNTTLDTDHFRWCSETSSHYIDITNIILQGRVNRIDLLHSHVLAVMLRFIVVTFCFSTFQKFQLK